MTWNHRVIRHKTEEKEHSEEYWYGIHEVYYDDKGEPDSCTKDPISLVGEDLKHLMIDIERIKECLEKPVIDYEYFEKLEKKE